MDEHPRPDEPRPAGATRARADEDAGATPDATERAPRHGEERPTQVTDEAMAALDSDDQEQPARVLHGRLAQVVGAVLAVVSAYAIYQVFRPAGLGTQFYLSIFLAITLPLTFLLFRSRKGAPGRRPTVVDGAFALVALLACLYPVLTGFDAFLDRQGLPSGTDVAVGALLTLLVLEATRRTVGLILPGICAAFLVYAYFGGSLPQGWSLAHSGRDLSEIVNGLTLGTSGIFGTPLDVAASYIILFTVYGAVLNVTGAGRFFVDLSFAAFRRSRSAPGRTVTMSGLLLGTVSGSGTATAVTLGSITWPILKRAGYKPEAGAGVLAAAGIGAILSPPTMGAAAFIIAEIMNVSYLAVMGYALIPTVLFYLGIVLAIEIDARRRGVREVDIATQSPWRLLGRFGYHFLSLVAIVVFLALGLSAMLAVVYATLLALVLSFLDPKHRITPRRLFEALETGARGALPVVATCAAAGIIVTSTTLTGLGLNLASIIVDTAAALGGPEQVTLAATAVLAAFAVTLLGLAVPVTASFIIAAVIIAPAFAKLGVEPAAIYMFVFYYAVLSEVSPPTALAATAAAAITGGRVMRSQVETLRYALPAFLVPLAFVLTDTGAALLGKGSPLEVVAAFAVSCVAVAALAAAAGGWIAGPAGPAERVLCLVAALLLLYLDPISVAAGVVALALALVLHLVLRGRRPRPAHATAPPAGPTPA